MNTKEMEELVELLVPYVIKKIKEDNQFKSYTRTKNATVYSITTDDNGSTINQNISVIFPYDTVSFSAKNKTGEELAVGDLVCIEYWVDLKNAVVKYKVN